MVLSVSRDASSHVHSFDHRPAKKKLDRVDRFFALNLGVEKWPERVDGHSCIHGSIDYLQCHDIYIRY